MDKFQAMDRLEEIQGELVQLGNEAASLFRKHFPSQYTSGEAYGAFSFGSSWNSYNTTLSSLIDSAKKYDLHESEEEEV